MIVNIASAHDGVIYSAMLVESCVEQCVKTVVLGNIALHKCRTATLDASRLAQILCNSGPVSRGDVAEDNTSTLETAQQMQNGQSISTPQP